MSDPNMNSLTSAREKNFLLIVCSASIFLCALYSFLPPGKSVFPWFLSLYSLHFIAHAVFLLLIRKVSIKIHWIIALAIITRLILLFSEPILEDDYWRYLWDGRVLANGMNPYRYTPLDPSLDHLDIVYRSQINWKQYGTIYPPLNLILFALIHKIAPDSLCALKILFILFDLGTGWILLTWLKKEGIDPKWSALYFLNPLVLKEIANSAHLDAIAIFFSFAAAFLLSESGQSKELPTSRWKALAAWALLALGVTSKIYPICFVPLFFKVDRWRWSGLLIFLIVLASLYIPFLDAGIHLLNGTEAYARHWIFNAGLYRVLQEGVMFLLSNSWISTLLAEPATQLLLKHDVLAKLLVGILFSLFVLIRSSRISSNSQIPLEITNILGALLILSPVVNAWYLLWILPFACKTRNFVWIFFSYLVVASYSWFYSQEIALYLRSIEYLLFFLALLVFFRFDPLKRSFSDRLFRRSRWYNLR